jgi:hypothetical protein
VSIAAAPLLKAPITFFLVGDATFDLAVFLTTVVALPSLVSLLALPRRPARVAGRDAGAAAPRRVLAGADAPDELELVFETVVTFRCPVCEDFAFSTMLDKRFVAAAAEREAPPIFKGEPGRAIGPLAGDAGLDLSLFARREFEDVGDSTCAGRTFAEAAA